MKRAIALVLLIVIASAAFGEVVIENTDPDSHFDAAGFVPAEPGYWWPAILAGAHLIVWIVWYIRTQT